MRSALRSAISLLVLGLSAGPDPAAAERATKGRTWTLDDMVAVPEVKDLAISHDGTRAAYVLRTVDVAKDRPQYELHVVDIGAHRDRIVATSVLMTRLSAIPGRATWSVLANFGKGLNLYEIGDGAGVAPIVESRTNVLVGNADGANFGYDEVGPMPVGVAFYDWSPDGKRLFYTTLEAVQSASRVVGGTDVTDASAQRRWRPRVRVRLYLRSGNEEPVEIASAPAEDRVARYMGAFPHWASDHLDYALQAVNNPTPSVWHYRWQFGSTQSTLLPGGAEIMGGDAPTGPNEGKILVTRTGDQTRLIERLQNGASFDYGAMNVQLLGHAAGGAWRTADGIVMLSVRFVDEARFGLVRLDRRGKATILPAKDSLRHCAFTPDALRGVCIREGLVKSPELVAVSTASGRIDPVLEIAPHYAAIKPLALAHRSWSNSFGFKNNGFIIYPRGYRRGASYPAIIVTHSPDADQRFASPDLVWSYPVYLLAERGYVVLLVNDPPASQSAILQKAQETWNSCDGRTPPWEVQRLTWLNTVESYRSLINLLSTEGLVDRERLGIAGYSAGSQMVNVAVTQSELFKAASSGDGAYLEPAANRYLQCSYRAVYGGAPGDPKAMPNYLALAPSYRAQYVTTPVLQQLAEPRVGAVDFYQALQVENVPADITLYPGETPDTDETHLFHIPSNRRAALVENLEWFDFWLRGIAPTSDPERAARWEKMRAQFVTARKAAD